MDLYVTVFVLALNIIHFDLTRENTGPVDQTTIDVDLYLESTSVDIKWRVRLADDSSIASTEFQWSARPTIGILSQEFHEIAPSLTNYSYIAASYVKYVESAGALVIPIRLNQSDEYYERVFNKINGLLLPGGETSIEHSGYALIAKKLFDWAIKSNEKKKVFPIFGICLGFEQLIYLAAGKNPLIYCEGRHYSTYITPCDGWNHSMMLGQMPESLLKQITSENITYNSHQYCLDIEDFKNYTKLDEFFNVYATSKDLNGNTFVAYVEGKHYPFFGVQWHPEKPMFEWISKEVPHDYKSILAGQYFINEFVKIANMNNNSVTQDDLDLLIYSYNPEFTMQKSCFVQTYMFEDFPSRSS